MIDVLMWILLITISILAVVGVWTLSSIIVEDTEKRKEKKMDYKEQVRDIEDIKADICDHYCKFIDKVNANEMDYDILLETLCDKCPLNELDYFERK